MLKSNNKSYGYGTFEMTSTRRNKEGGRRLSHEPQAIEDAGVSEVSERAYWAIKEVLENQTAFFQGAGLANQRAFLQELKTQLSANDIIDVMIKGPQKDKIKDFVPEMKMAVSAKEAAQQLVRRVIEIRRPRVYSSHSLGGI